MENINVDVKALLRIAVLHNIPTACNLATANYFVKTWQPTKS